MVTVQAGRRSWCRRGPGSGLTTTWCERTATATTIGRRNYINIELLLQHSTIGVHQQSCLYCRLLPNITAQLVPLHVVLATKFFQAASTCEDGLPGFRQCNLSLQANELSPHHCYCSIGFIGRNKLTAEFC